jgi:hypothetical protein
MSLVCTCLAEDFDFDWTRTGDESIYRVLMQLGDGHEFKHDSQDAGAGVNLVWSVIDGEHQSLGYGDGGSITPLHKLSGPAHISVTADLNDHTYSVSVDGHLVERGIPFDNSVPLNTVRFLTDQLNEKMFSGRTFDNVLITGESGGNHPPFAEAGRNRNVRVGATVTLDGSASSDADGDDLTFSWTLVHRPGESTATLTDADSATPSFTADRPGTYQAELLVNDGTDLSDPDTVTINVADLPENSPPEANAGSDRDVRVGVTVTLDGSASSDADGDDLTFSWSLVHRPDESTAALTGADTSNPSFVADRAGTYEAVLVVNDEKVDSDPDSVTIEANTPPEANAGEDQNVETGDTVSLDGTASSDPDGDTLTYNWILVTIPDESTAALTGADTSNPRFTADRPGT